MTANEWIAGVMAAIKCGSFYFHMTSLGKLFARVPLSSGRIIWCWSKSGDA